MRIRVEQHRHSQQTETVENRLFTGRGRRASSKEQSKILEITEREEHHDGEFDQILAFIVENTPRHPLPFRDDLENLLGQDVPSDVQVIYGQDVSEWLDILDADALAHHNLILLDEPDADMLTIAHEVVHVLQVNHLAPSSNDMILATDSAEHEAKSVVQELDQRQQMDNWDSFLPIAIESAISPQDYAANRADTPPAPVEDTDTAERDFEQETTTQEAQEESGSQAEEVETPETEQTLEEFEPVEESEEVELEPPALPEAPEPGVDEADVEARRAELAEAEAALEGAEDAEGVVDAFAGAPPTLKARESGNVAGQIDEKVQTEETTYQENIPDFHAELNLQSEDVPANEIAMPEQTEVNVEPDAVNPAPDVDLPPTPDQGDYTANNDVISRMLSWVSSWLNPDEDRARKIGDNLNSVSTSDPDVSSDPGEPPRVPLEGENDPQRIDNQRDQSVDQSRQKRDEAQQGVINGPGPEQVQPQNMDEPVSIGELQQPVVEANVDNQGPETYLQYGLPEEVDTAFDIDNSEAMEQSYAEARQKVSDATNERDEARETTVSEAETEAERLNSEADDDQREQVVTARNDIQTERQSTLDSQRNAVQDLETDVETRRSEDQGKIEDRVTTDEQQITDDYDQAERDAQDEIDTGERDAEAEKRASEREADNQSWWDRAVNFVKAAFKALTEAINAIFDLVRAAINKILDAVKELATRLIRAAADFIKSAITAFGDFLKSAINTLLADTFPELAEALNNKVDSVVETANNAVDAVADGLIAGINALVEGLRAALNKILDIWQAAINAVLNIIAAVLTGDWGAVIRLAFEAVLKVAGIDPEEIYAFIGRAQETFSLILDAPIQFVGNLFNAFIGGVQQFADRILEHLQAGIIGWLTGALGPTGIVLPEEFNLIGVLDIIRQVLGFTWDNIRSRVVRIVGERGTAILEFVGGYIETLVTEGWSGLWEQITNDLATLRDMIFDQIKEFVLTRLIIAAVTRLATMFNPVGAIVNLIIMVYQFYTFLRDNIQRLVQLIRTIVDAIGNIARGVLGPAMDYIENTLAQFLPLAIDLVARLIGLGNIGGRVRNIMIRVQERIWGAIDGLIERVLARFRGGGEGATTDGQPADDAEAEGAQQLGESIPIPAPDTTHHLSIEVAGTNITFVVNSQKQTVEQLISMWTERAKTLEDEPKAQAEGLLATLSTTENASERTIEDLLKDADISQSDQSTASAEEQELVPALIGLFRIFGTEGVEADTEQKIQLLFADELQNADVNARPALERELISNSDKVIENGHKKPNWLDEIKSAIFYHRPLLQETKLGQETRKTVIPWLTNEFTTLQANPPSSKPIVPPADYNHFHGTRVGMIHRVSDDFPTALRLVRDQILQGSLAYTSTTSSTMYVEYNNSINTYISGTPTPHTEFEPIELSSVNLGSATIHTYTYKSLRIQKQDGTIEDVTPPVFNVTMQDGKVIDITGSGLRFKEIIDGIQSGQRGRMQSPPDYDSNLLLNRSHLVADEFMGSAFNNANNVVVTSETYNQIDMRNAERGISSEITNRVNAHAGQEVPAEDISFNINIVVTYADSVFDDFVRQQADDRFEALMRQHQSIITDVEELQRQWTQVNLTLQFKLNQVQPVRRLLYTVTPYYQGTPLSSFNSRVGPDVYLGLEIGELRKLFKAAAGV